MKNKKQLSIKSTFKIISFVFAAVLLSSCSKKIVFPNSNVLPAAEAILRIDENKSNNYEIDLEVENMAKPERLTPPRRTYVVWMISEDHGTMNLGNLRVANNNEAELNTTTPYKPIRVFITAEDSKSVITPSTQVVLSTDDFSID